jgi:hypothetical protein
MEFSLQDLFDGSIAGTLKLHLSELAAVQPYKLETLVEATFPGYAAADFVSNQRQGYDTGFAYLEGSAVFLNSTDNTTFKVVTAWLTGTFDGNDQLIAVISPLAEGGVSLPHGYTTLQLVFCSFERK